jgi:hypothetical protein
VLREYMSWPRCEARQDVIEQYSELTNIHRRSSSSKLFSFPCLLLLLSLFHLGSLLIRALTPGIRDIILVLLLSSLVPSIADS